MTTSVDYAFAGGLRVDTILTPDGCVYAGAIGGNAAFAAAGARAWGAAVGMIARVGANYPAAWWDTFAQAGIATDGVTRVPGVHDMRTFYAYLSQEERDDRNPAAHFARLGLPLPDDLAGYQTSTGGQEDLHAWAPLAVRPEDVPAAYAGLRAAHVAPAHVLTQLHLPGALRAAGARLVTLDPSERLMLPDQADTLRAVLADVDVFLPSEAEVHRGLPGVELWDAAAWLAAQGPAVVVIKIGARGQLVYLRETGARLAVPAAPAQVVDVTGAGDAYCGGFLVGYERTGDPLQAAQYGAVSAALAIEGVGALHAASAPQAAQQRLKLFAPQRHGDTEYARS
jgi:sugar/nucleoside kinase (ribokinase family)